MHYFPFDHQECELRFGSLTYNAHELTFAQYTDEIDRKDDLISEGTDEMRTDDYVESVSWNIINVCLVHHHFQIREEFICTKQNSHSDARQNCSTLFKHFQSND